MEPIDLDHGQRAAVDAARQFVASNRSGYLTIGGLAGTGKTTVAQAVARLFPSATLLTPTVRAAQNLSRKLDRPAHTIHSTIKKLISEKEEDGRTRLIWGNKPFSARLAILDEYSMVTREIGADLLKVCHQVIAFGDPGQLPPVDGEPYFTEPEILLEKPYRQGDRKGIINQAHAVRNGADYSQKGDGPEFQYVFASLEDAADLLTKADMIICHTNYTRHEVNTFRRSQKGLSGPVIRAGEMLLGRRNNRQLGIVNGGRYAVDADRKPGEPLHLISLEGGEPVEVRGAVETIDPTPPHRFVPFFGFGYASTVHSAQGSEWDRVVVIDDFARLLHGREKWLYTAITRGAEQVTILRMRIPPTPDEMVVVPELEDWIAI